MAAHGVGFLEELSRQFGDAVRSDALSRGMHATDASMFQQEPAAVLAPRSASEVRDAVVLCARHGVPVLARGAGTSLAGQATALGALVLDVSRHLDTIEDVAIEARTVRVGPGVVRDRLNADLAASGLMFAPETSTSNRATIGGMIANNSSGTMSIRYGKTIDHLVEAEVVLADGSQLRLGTPDRMDARGRELLEQLLDIVSRNRYLIEQRFPKVMRRVGGYPLDEFLGERHNLARILAGSEGTLAILTRATVSLVPRLRHIGALAVQFSTLDAALRAMPFIVERNPLSAELMDGELMAMCLANPTTASLCDWVVGQPGTVVSIEFEGADEAEVTAELQRLSADLSAAGLGTVHVLLASSTQRARLAEVRRQGLGIMLKMVGDAKPIALIEDAAVPVEHLADYAARVIAVCAELGVRVVTYGHASVGLLHLRPVINLKSREGRALLYSISERAVEIVKEYGGSWAGEHGDGIARGAVNDLYWGEDMMDVFRSVKRLFDPKGLLNPGKIFDTPPLDGPLRFHDGYRTSGHVSAFHFRDAGGLLGAVEMCNGVGACRKLGSGTMCPSYMATRDEKDSTRGRANALRLAMSGQLGDRAFPSQELKDVLDLCLECKACRTECPSNVDMARLKSEFLHAWNRDRGPSLRDRVFAQAPRMARLIAGKPARLVNALLADEGVQGLVSGLLGLNARKPLPLFAEKPFTQPPPTVERPRSNGKTVVLFADTYSKCHEPAVARWAMSVLIHFGYRVELADAGCCCRPLISKGFLDEARQAGGRTLGNIASLAIKGWPIIVLEPSCASALSCDLPDLVDDESLEGIVAPAVTTLEDFLFSEFQQGRLALPNAAEDSTSHLIHTHCHQKALGPGGALAALLREAGHVSKEIGSGCCGMAGSFGYEREHAEVSARIGEDRLFPVVRASSEETVIVSNGFSCRHQLAHGTGAKAIHGAEAIGRALGLTIDD